VQEARVSKENAICLPETKQPQAKLSGSPAINRLDGRVTSVRYVGPLATIEMDYGFALRGYLLAPQARAMNIEPGRLVAVEIAADAIHVMASEPAGRT
jgi:hypothetical protein